MQTDEQEIRQLVSTWMEATKAGDVDTVLSLMAEDVVFLVPGQPVMRKAGFAAAARAQADQQAPRRILRPPTDYPYGERQYTAADPAGHVWTFSQTLADVDPASWGGTLA